MIKYNLKCHNAHEFESWFSKSTEFDKLKNKNLLECIFCKSKKIEKSIMAPMISNSKSKNQHIENYNQDFLNEKKKLLQLRKYVEKNFDFVGKDFCKKVREIYYDKKNKNNFLEGLHILDIGCGGGLIGEPMARLGAKVTGIDAAEKNINVAKIHAKKSGLEINFINTSPENLNKIEKFDIILNLEIVEHVDNVNLYIKSCYNLLKKNGLMFTATLNRSFTSYIKAIIGAEYVLRWLPIGTHNWNKFLKPEELENILSKEKFTTVDVKGLEFNPILGKWKKSNNLSVNYIISSLKS